MQPPDDDNTPALIPTTPRERALLAENADLRRQRDNALRRITELVGESGTHRARLEDARLLASQSHNRAQRLQALARVRNHEGARAIGRRQRDVENEELRKRVDEAAWNTMLARLKGELP